METVDDEMNIIEATGGGKGDPENENNNNVEVNECPEQSTFRDEESGAQERNEKRKKFFQQYIYQQNYQEALRSLLWEPYDCREDSDSWYYRGLDGCKPGAIASEVPKREPLSSSESSISSFSSYSSLDEILTVEMTQKSALNNDKRYSLSLEMPREMNKRAYCSLPRRVGRELKLLKTKEKSTLLAESKREDEEERFLSGFSESRCTTDPVQNQMNIEIMVSDLHKQNGDGISSLSGRGGAPDSENVKMSASASQYNVGSRGESACVSVGEYNVKHTVDKMLVTVEGTLEPRDSNEGTQLVSPDTSLDLNDNPVRLTGQNQNRVEPGPSGGNVSVVNCYRAVPVSVVSTVPTIKCLNTQENVSNVNIIQTSSNSEQKPIPTKRAQPQPQPQPQPQSQPKRLPARINNGSAPSTSRIRAKVQNRDVTRSQIRHSAILEQNVNNHGPKIERERPKSSNVCLSEVSSEPLGQTPSVCENGPSSSNNSSSVLSNHNRSISNPVLGNQIKSMPNRYGSQQNIPIRLETHFGPNSPDGTELSQTYLTQRNPGPSPDTRSEQEMTTSQGTENNVSKPSPRTFTSTEAQTDDVPLDIHPRNVISREQRRRERRERRHQRRLHQSVLNGGSVWQTNVDMVHRDRRGLPDILNSHMPPPYSAVSMPPMATMPPPIHVPPPMPVPPGPQTVPHLVDSPPGQPLPHQGGLRFPFPFPGGGRRSQGQMFAHEEETPKSCCGVVVTQTVSIRWFIVMISFVGTCCVIVGTVLGAMKASGREHLTVSLLMIGVGIVLVTVSVVAWRLTSQNAPSCRSMLGLRGGEDSSNEPNQRFVPRMPPSYGRPHHPYAAMMYPEFQYRPPPPSYQASMQEYRLRLLLLERPNETAAGLQATMSPPPTYRSQAGSTLGLRAPTLCRSLPQSEYSHPPSYRSRTSSTRPTLDPNGDTLGSVNHSRNSSLLSHVSDQNGNVSQAVVNVISVMGNTVDLHRGDTDLQIDSIKLGVDEEVPIPPLRMLLNKGKRSPTTSSEDTKSENVNLVTIVTVSDNNTAPNRDHSVESDVLAHL